MGLLEITEAVKNIQNDLSEKISDTKKKYEDKIGSKKAWLDEKLEELNTLYADATDILEQKKAEVLEKYEEAMKAAEDWLKSKMEELEQRAMDKINEKKQKMQEQIDKELEEEKEVLKQDAETKAKISAEIKLRKKK